MFRFPIGVILESFRLERSAAISAAAELGAAGIQMYATMGENAPENLTAGDRRALRREVEDAGLVFSALCGDLGQGFGDAEKNSLLIESPSGSLIWPMISAPTSSPPTSALFRRIRSIRAIRSCRRPASNWRITPRAMALICGGDRPGARRTATRIFGFSRFGRCSRQP